MFTMQCIILVFHGCSFSEVFIMFYELKRFWHETMVQNGEDMSTRHTSWNKYMAVEMKCLMGITLWYISLNSTQPVRPVGRMLNAADGFVLLSGCRHVAVHPAWVVPARAVWGPALVCVANGGAAVWHAVWGAPLQHTCRHHQPGAVHPTAAAQM